MTMTYTSVSSSSTIKMNEIYRRDKKNLFGYKSSKDIEKEKNFKNKLLERLKKK